MDVPVVMFLVSVAVVGLYYTIVCITVPAKRNLSYKGRLALYMSRTAIGSFNDVIMAIFSVLSCVLFVWETYLPEDLGTPTWMFSAEVLFSVGFAFQYLLSLYTAPNKLQFIISLQAVVDVVTTVPVFVTLATASYSLTAGVGFLRFSRVMKFTRVLRLLRLHRSVSIVSSAADNAIRHQMILLISTILSILVITTGFVQFLGNEVEKGQWGALDRVDFHDALYFTVVTFTTVGYGDISPSGTIGRAVMLCIIAVTFVLVPFETSKLVRLTRMRSAYGGRLGRMAGHQHVIVACDVMCAGVSDFLKEFFHEDHGGQATRVVLLSPGEPTATTKSLLLQYKRVTYLKGDAMNGDDLIRARADKAVGCFVLTNRFTSDTDEMDSITVLRALNVKSFNEELRTFVQIIEPENVVHVLSAGVKPENVLCINSVKLGLLGQSCVFPGFSTVITNLVVSLAYSAEKAHRKWQEEYGAGLQQEIYSLVLPAYYDGHGFADTAVMIYRYYGCTLFAVGVPQEPHGLSIMLNPGSHFKLRQGYVAFLIAEDVGTIQRISVHGPKTTLDMPTPTFSQLNLLSPASAKRQHKKLTGATWTRKLASMRLAAAKSPKVAEEGPAPSHGILEEAFTPATKARPRTVSIDRASHSTGRPHSHRDAPTPRKSVGRKTATVAAAEAIAAANPDDPRKQRPHKRSSASGAGASVASEAMAPGPPQMQASLAGLGEAGDNVIRSTPRFRLPGSAGAMEDARKSLSPKQVLRKQGSDMTDPDMAALRATSFGYNSAGSLTSLAPLRTVSSPDPVRAVTELPVETTARPRVDTLDTLSGDDERKQGFVEDSKAVPRTPGSTALHLARATFVQSITEVIDSMHGTIQEDLVEDICAVLSTVAIPPAQQSSLEVCIEATPTATATDRRHSFLGDSIVRQPSFGKRALESISALDLTNAANPGAAGIKDHVVVVCTSPDDLQYLIAPLRSNYLSRMPPVVVLCPEQPDERMWAEISSFENVLYVQGVPHLRDLKRAGIDNAECAVILAKNTEPVSSGHFSAQDAEVVLTVLDIQACVQRSIRTLAELNCSRYMKHLGAPLATKRTMLDRQHGFYHKTEAEGLDLGEDESYVFESSYTSGKVLPANFLESLLCQAYFNPYIVSLVNAMICGCPMGQTGQDRLRRNSLDVHAALPFTHSAPHQAKRCSVQSHGMQITIPDDFEGTTYGELYQHLLFEYDMLPIGLYRYGQDLGNDLPFVYTNPAASTELAEQDLVFVFGPCQLGTPSCRF